MSNPVARRYAQALYQEAERQGRLDAVGADVDLLRQSLENAPELGRFFHSPIIAREKKKAVVEELFEERLSALTYRLVQLLVDKEREALLGHVLTAYRALVDRKQGIVEVQVRTARPLDEAGRRKLSGAVERMTGRQARLHVAHEPALIGGVVLRVGDTVYDGSVRNQLAALRERMQHGAMSVN